MRVKVSYAFLHERVKVRYVHMRVKVRYAFLHERVKVRYVHMRVKGTCTHYRLSMMNDREACMKLEYHSIAIIIMLYLDSVLVH